MDMTMDMTRLTVDDEKYLCLDGKRVYYSDTDERIDLTMRIILEQFRSMKKEDRFKLRVCNQDTFNKDGHYWERVYVIPHDPLRPKIPGLLIIISWSSSKPWICTELIPSGIKTSREVLIEYHELLSEMIEPTDDMSFYWPTKA